MIEETVRATSFPSLPVLASPISTGGCGAPDPPAPAHGHHHLRLGSVPRQGMAITHLDIDLTVACNLACTYCFKDKWKQHMELKTAIDAVIWLIHASGNAKDISLVFIGGEPLLRFDTIKRLVPFAVRRARQHHKRLKMSITTNGTLVSEDILSFFRKWRIGFHTSIDGHPAVQDTHRIYRDGRGSSKILEANLPKILKVWPTATARSTICPDTAKEIYASYEYFLGLGYIDIAFVPGDPAGWSEESIQEYRTQFDQVGGDVIRKFREGTFIKVKFIDDICQSRAEGKTGRPGAPCGAGRGMALVDVNGALWPCHRWNSASSRAGKTGWRQGSIYEPSFAEETRLPFQAGLPHHVDGVSCDTCRARTICGGGCPAENLEFMGDLHVRHPNDCTLTELMANVGHTVFDTLSAEANPLFLRTYPIRERASANAAARR